MKVKVIGFDRLNFTAQDTGEVVNGAQLYLEDLTERSGRGQFGHLTFKKFFRDVGELKVGGVYELVGEIRPNREGKLEFFATGLKASN